MEKIFEKRNERLVFVFWNKFCIPSTMIIMTELDTKTFLKVLKTLLSVHLAFRWNAHANVFSQNSWLLTKAALELLHCHTPISMTSWQCIQTISGENLYCKQLLWSYLLLLFRFIFIMWNNFFVYIACFFIKTYSSRTHSTVLQKKKNTYSKKENKIRIKIGW